MHERYFVFILDNTDQSQPESNLDGTLTIALKNTTRGERRLRTKLIYSFVHRMSTTSPCMCTFPEILCTLSYMCQFGGLLAENAGLFVRTIVASC